MIIRMPDLNKIASELHDEITAKGKGQLVKEIAGRIVGRVPANLAKIFRKWMKILGSWWRSSYSLSL